MENQISIDKPEAFFTATTFDMMRYNSSPERFSVVGEVETRELLALPLIAIINVASILIKVLIDA